MSNTKNTDLEKKKAEARLSDFIRNLKINAIVIVDDARKVTSEDMKRIHEELEMNERGHEGHL